MKKPSNGRKQAQLHKSFTFELSFEDFVCNPAQKGIE